MCIVALAMQTMVFAETIGVFYDSTVEQIEFAAGDVKTALESKGFTVEMQSINQLNAVYANKKVIIALATDRGVKAILTARGGTAPTGLGEQAYALRTTNQGETSFWALGGDNNGAMYGGLQLAENIKMNGFTGSLPERMNDRHIEPLIEHNLRSWLAIRNDDVFKNMMSLRYPNVSSENLFTAWSKASRGLPLVGEMITGTLGRDNQWWPEACQFNSGFLNVEDFGNANAENGSTLASIAETASGELEGKRSAFDVAVEIETDAKAALSFPNSIGSDANTELGVAVNNMKAMSSLTIYYAYKIRGATYLKANEKEKAKNSLETAYCWWMKYSKLMDNMYTGMDMARTKDLPDWHAHDKSVLKEYTDLGGEGVPSCNLNLK